MTRHLSLLGFSRRQQLLLLRGVQHVVARFVQCSALPPRLCGTKKLEKIRGGSHRHWPPQRDHNLTVAVSFLLKLMADGLLPETLQLVCAGAGQSYH